VQMLDAPEVQNLTGNLPTTATVALRGTTAARRVGSKQGLQAEELK